MLAMARPADVVTLTMITMLGRTCPYNLIALASKSSRYTGGMVHSDSPCDDLRQKQATAHKY